MQGSSWDPDSVMHYPFEPGLILQPEKYRAGLQPAGGLSQRDGEWVHTFYPPLTPADDTELALLEAKRLQITPGEQRSFVLKPTVDRYYEIRTFGVSDTVIVLFERDVERPRRLRDRRRRQRRGPQRVHPASAARGPHVRAAHPPVLRGRFGRDGRDVVVTAEGGRTCA